jgi:hypothetical protein
MKKFLPAFLLATFYLNISNAGVYYWVGGTGNYNDPQHWATTSGGNTFQSVAPMNWDSVYFDINSFLSANDTVYFDSLNNYAYSFSVNGVLNIPTFYHTHVVTNLSVDGDFYLDAGIHWEANTEVIFNSGDTFIHTIRTNGNYLNEVNEVSYGPFKLLDDLHCGDLTISGGGFESSGFNIYCLYANIFSPGPLYFGTSVINAQAVSLFLGATQPPVIFGDSATFIAQEYFEIDTAAGSINIGTVQTRTIRSVNCFYRNIIASYVEVDLTGTGNHVDLVSGNISAGNNASASNPNYLTKVMAVDTFISTGNNVVDTLIFSNAGVELEVSDTLEITGEIIMDNSPSKYGNFHAGVGPAYFKKLGGIVCFDFVFLQDINTTGGAQFFAGYNSADMGGNNGWQFTGCITPGGAWPGDANYDLIVNNLDILALGIANGETGSVRVAATNSWVEQPVSDWTNSYVTGVNYKHADCDGNGVVDLADTTAIYLNYGLHHPASRFSNGAVTINSTAVLSVNISPDSAGANTSLHINIDLTADSIYGIAFSVFYDPTLIDAASLISDFNNSWLGTSGVNMIGFAKAVPTEGKIDFALTRIDHTNAVGGVGDLVSFDLTTAPTILSPATLTMQVDNVNGIYSSQTFEGITGNSDSTYVDELVSVNEKNNSIHDLTSFLDDKNLSVQFYSDHVSQLQLALTDLMGRIILTEQVITISGINKKEIPVKQLVNGVYFLTLTDNGNTISLKLIKRD